MPDDTQDDTLEDFPDLPHQVLDLGFQFAAFTASESPYYWGERYAYSLYDSGRFKRSTILLAG